MKILKDKKIIALAIVLMVFTIVYFVVVNKISYAFSNDFNTDKDYEKVVDIIKESAIVYAEKNKGLFKEDKIIYIKVQDLIDNNLLIANANGEIVNPLNKTQNMNSNIIKIKLEDDKFIAEVDS
jgi:hypothetical protein